MPAGRNPVRGDNTKHRKLAVRNPDVAFRQMFRNVCHELRGGHAATNFAMHLDQNFIDASIQEVLCNDRVGMLNQEATLYVRNVHPLLLRRRCGREVGPHEFVDASLVHGRWSKWLGSMAGYAAVRCARLGPTVAVGWQRPGRGTVSPANGGANPEAGRQTKAGE